MEIAKLIVDLIGKVIWPLVLMVIVWKFRKQIAIRLKDINEIELPGFKAKLDRAIDERFEKKTEELDLIEELELIKEEQIKNELSAKIDYEEDEAGSDTLLAFTANTTHVENLKYDIYYDPVTRNHNLPFKYIGLYAWKKIFAVGEVRKIVSCDYDNGKLIGTNGYNLEQLSADEYERIKGIIENTVYYDIKHGIKFFLVDKFYNTNYIKSSDYPIRAKKYIWLDDIEGFKQDMTSSQLAALLRGKEWE
jgi:hypothetical protein